MRFRLFRVAQVVGSVSMGNTASSGFGCSFSAAVGGREGISKRVRGMGSEEGGKVADFFSCKRRWSSSKRAGTRRERGETDGVRCRRNPSRKSKPEAGLGGVGRSSLADQRKEARSQPRVSKMRPQARLDGICDTMGIGQQGIGAGSSERCRDEEASGADGRVSGSQQRSASRRSLKKPRVLRYEAKEARSEQQA